MSLSDQSKLVNADAILPSKFCLCAHTDCPIINHDRRTVKVKVKLLIWEYFYFNY